MNKKKTPTELKIFRIKKFTLRNNLPFNTVDNTILKIECKENKTFLYDMVNQFLTAPDGTEFCYEGEWDQPFFDLNNKMIGFNGFVD